MVFVFFFQAEDGIRDAQESRGLGDVYKRQMDILIDPTHGVAQSLKEIEAVGHRLVHAGASFKQSVLINEAVREKLYECIEFAPLHNPHNIKGIEASLKKLPHTPNAVSYTHLRAHETPEHLVCRLLLEKKKTP